MSLTTVIQCPTWLNQLSFKSKDSTLGQKLKDTNQTVASQGCSPCGGKGTTTTDVPRASPSCVNPIEKTAENYKACPGNISRSGGAAGGGMFSGGMNSAVGWLHSIRDPVAEYQAQRGGLSPNEKYTFVQLITSLCQHAYNAALIIVTMLYNLMPLLDGFLCLFRFVLDKLIDIFEAQDTQNKIWKSVVFVAEFIVIVMVMMIIGGIILLPIWALFSHIFAQVWGIVISK